MSINFSQPFANVSKQQKTAYLNKLLQLVEKGRQLATFFSSYHPTCSKMYVG